MGWILYLFMGRLTSKFYSESLLFSLTLCYARVTSIIGSLLSYIDMSKLIDEESRLKLNLIIPNTCRIGLAQA